MNMEMDRYWSQRRVFFFGQAALFPKTLIGQVVDEDGLLGLLPDGYKSYLITEPAATTGGHAQVKIVDIDTIRRAKSIVDLKDYLRKYQGGHLTTKTKDMPTDFIYQEQRLVSFARKSTRTNRWRKTVNLTDLWPDQKERNKHATTFWELLLAEHLIEDNIQLLNVGYEGAYSDASGKRRPLPFAEFKILPRNTFFQMATVPTVAIPGKRVVEKPAVQAAHKATLTLDRRRLRVTVDGKPYPFKRYTSKSDSYRGISKLYAYPEEKLALVRFEFNSTRTALKDVPKSMGFTGILRKLFIEYDNSTVPATLLLHKTVTIDDPEQYSELLNFVNNKRSADRGI